MLLQLLCKFYMCKQKYQKQAEISEAKRASRLLQQSFITQSSIMWLVLQEHSPNLVAKAAKLRDQVPHHLLARHAVEMNADDLRSQILNGLLQDGGCTDPWAFPVPLACCVDPAPLVTPHQAQPVTHLPSWCAALLLLAAERLCAGVYSLQYEARH